MLWKDKLPGIIPQPHTLIVANNKTHPPTQGYYPLKGGFPYSDEQKVPMPLLRFLSFSSIKRLVSLQRRTKGAHAITKILIIIIN